MTKIGGPSGPPQQPPNVGSTEAAKSNEPQKTSSASDGSAAASNPPTTQASDSGKTAEHAMSGYVMGAKIQAQAEREMPPIKPNQQIDLTDKDYRNHMLRSAPQVNDVSIKAGNAPNICGGAAMANALILSSKTPEQSKANAKAVRDLAGSLDPKVKLTPEEDQALKNMEKDKPTLSAVDAQHLQQAMYRIGQTMPLAAKNPEGKGMSTTQVGCAMSMLSAKGAFKGSNVTMHCNRNTFQDDQKNNYSIDHWTVTVDGTHANSQAANNKSLVHGGPPSDRLKGNDNWQNEITLYRRTEPPELNIQFKQPNNRANEYQETTVNPNKFSTPEQMLAFEDEMRKAAANKPETW
jgi:hypothetical protein